MAFLVVKTLIKPWKGLKPRRTCFLSFLRWVKTLIKPWKGLKRYYVAIPNSDIFRVKTLIKPWKGLKQGACRLRLAYHETCENPNKTLEGIKTANITWTPSDW
ncbi:hypothetical protein U27_01429 [Candidatus Vecturithrix granuli]|uniref:Uncharacterized protein n=1 Tax=Vecturithrix granuli TaxID=1499967 RepID=A0A081CAC3_VECG1|nr:hypothetical protein U27_01429 [Candidatus Vecturithrix granuli]